MAIFPSLLYIYCELKRHPFQAEPPIIAHYREWPPGLYRAPPGPFLTCHAGYLKSLKGDYALISVTNIQFIARVLTKMIDIQFIKIYYWAISQMWAVFN